MSITARGDQVAFVARQQADFDTPEPAAAGKFRHLPFYSLNMAPNEDSSEDDAIVGDAFPGAAVAGLQNATGDIEVPLGIASIGHHLRGFLGDPVTTGAGPYTHVFKMAALPVPILFTTGISHRSIDRHFIQAPIAYTGFSISARKDGALARARFDLLGSVETKVAAAADATPVEFAGDKVPVGFQGGAYQDGVKVGGVTGLEITAGISMEPDQSTMNELPTAAGFLDGSWSVTGSMSARVRDTVLYDLGVDGTLTDIELRYDLGAAGSMVIRIHNVKSERTGIPVPGGDILTATYNWRASRPEPGDTPMTVTLINDVADYDNLV